MHNCTITCNSPLLVSAAHRPGLPAVPRRGDAGQGGDGSGAEHRKRRACRWLVALLYALCLLTVCATPGITAAVLKCWPRFRLSTPCSRCGPWQAWVRCAAVSAVPASVRAGWSLIRAPEPAVVSACPTPANRSKVWKIRRLSQPPKILPRIPLLLPSSPPTSCLSPALPPPIALLQGTTLGRRCWRR